MEVALEDINIWDMVVTLEAFKPLKFIEFVLVDANIDVISKTFETFHFLISIDGIEAPLNIEDILVTLEVSSDDISREVTLIEEKNPFILTTCEVSKF